MRYKFIGVLVFLVVFLLNPWSAFADNEFTTSYDVNYDVSANGYTQVTEKITLKNLTARYYASNFTLTIGSTTVTEVSANDDSGNMETNVENKNNKTSITVKFNQQIAGVDKEQTFTLKYKSKDFAQAIGKTWEINLPRVPASADVSDYKLTLSVPVSFGDPTSISPAPKSQFQNYDRLSFYFDKDQIERNGVSVNFGTFQLFDFNIKYKLENPTLLPEIVSVALPPDTQYQDVLIKNMQPQPLNVTRDNDGNYLAWYKLPQKSTQEVIASGSAKVYITSKNKQLIKLSDDKLQPWLKSDVYWEKDNPAITATLNEIFKNGMPKTAKERANGIYDYVVDTLQYDSSRINNTEIERLGAVTVLNNPKSAVCMEFTDLFVALSRAAGVPAREMDGYAYSQNKDLRPLSFANLLHAWPEYYDPAKGWIMVDPTWENTSGGVDYFNKFDLNHLVLAVKGVSSRTPYISDDVKVEISTSDFTPHSEVKLEADMPQVIYGGFPATIKVKVTNQGNSLQPPTTLSISSNQIEIIGNKTMTLGTIPPLGSTTYNFNIKTPFTIDNLNESVKITVAGQEITKSIEIKPFFFFGAPYTLIGAIVLITGIYGLTFALHLHRKRQESSEKAN